MTLLSVIIANYNNGPLLRRCVSSILQEAPLGEFEILIVDDQSTDNSLEIIKELAQSPPVRFHCRKQNGGIEAANNTGLALAQGEYIHLFAADDLYLPGALRTLLALIKSHPTIPIFCADYASFPSSQPETISSKKMLLLPSFRFFTPQEAYLLFRHTDFWIPGHTVCVKKTAYLPHTPQDQRLRSVSDWYIYHTMALEGGVGYFPNALIARREDPSSYSASANFSEKRAIWLHLLSLLAQHPGNLLAQSGMCRMLGLRAIYCDLLKTPRYWKYLFPMFRKELEKRCFGLLGINREHYWLRRL
jgi:glycosyltransferase involved in cell wall biosynthesis